jgi:hypothetical protein
LRQNSSTIVRWIVRLRAALHGHSLDNRLLAGEPPSATPELAERCARLLDPGKRRRLAQWLRGALEEASRPAVAYRFTAKIPLQRAEIRECGPLIETLADELANEPRVSPRGVIMVERLLRDGRSPLYGGYFGLLVEREDSVGPAVRHARSALLMG